MVRGNIPLPTEILCWYLVLRIGLRDFMPIGENLMGQVAHIPKQMVNSSLLKSMLYPQARHRSQR